MMKTFRVIRTCAIAIAVTLSLSSCSDDNESNEKVICPTDYPIEYDENGVWKNCYDVNSSGFTLGEFEFSHTASFTEWGGIKYYSWKGFCPSKSADNIDHTGDDWTLYQWGAITAGGLQGKSSSYLLGCWAADENITAVPENPTCKITCGGLIFDPDDVYVTNSTWGYFAMKNGSAFNNQFKMGDWCKLHIIGTLKGIETGRVDVLLANGTNILNQWKEVDLDPLGNVDMIYFQMTSSDTGDWGMNNPAYFCLDRFEVDFDIK